MIYNIFNMIYVVICSKFYYPKAQDNNHSLAIFYRFSPFAIDWLLLHVFYSNCSTFDMMGVL